MIDILHLHCQRFLPFLNTESKVLPDTLKNKKTSKRHGIFLNRAMCAILLCLFLRQTKTTHLYLFRVFQNNFGFSFSFRKNQHWHRNWELDHTIPSLQKCSGEKVASLKNRGNVLLISVRHFDEVEFRRSHGYYTSMVV